MSTRHPALPLPRLSAGETRALNTLAHAGQRLALPGWPGATPGTAPLLSLQLGPAPAALGTAQDWRRLSLHWSGGRLLVDLPAALLQVWAGLRLGGSDAVALPAAWQDVAWQEAAQSLCDTLSAAGRGPAMVAGLGPCDGQAPAGSWHSLGWQLAGATPQRLDAGMLYADAMGLLLLAGLLPPASADSANTEWGGLPMPMRLTLGETDLPWQRLRTLQPGDVVFLSRSFLAGQGRVQLRCGAPGHPGWRFDAQLDPHGLTVLDTPMPHQDLPAADAGEALDAPGASDLALPDLGQLRIRLSFDVGDKTLTLAELQALRPGQVLPLDQATIDYVKVRANGALVGHGHLVEIDGRLGVSLASLVPPAAPAA